MQRPYEINISKPLKQVSIIVDCTIQKDTLQMFMVEMASIMKCIRPEEYTLIIDGSKFYVQNKQSLEELGSEFQFYQSFHFKGIYIKYIGNIFKKMQLNRLAKELEMNNVFVE